MASLRINPKHMRRALAEIGTAAQKHDLLVELAICHGRCVVGAFLKTGRPVPIAVANGTAWTLIAEVTASLRLPDRWIDEELTTHLLEAASASRLVQEGRDAGLLLSINETARVLAHKLSLIGPGEPRKGSDAADIMQLLRSMRAVTRKQVEAMFERHCPDLTLTPEANELVSQVLSAKDTAR